MKKLLKFLKNIKGMISILNCCAKFTLKLLNSIYKKNDYKIDFLTIMKYLYTYLYL